MFPSDLRKEALLAHSQLYRRLYKVELTEEPRFNIIKCKFSFQKRVIVEEDHRFSNISTCASKYSDRLVHLPAAI